MTTENAAIKGTRPANRFAMKYSKTTCLALCALFAALTAICAYITIPLGFTPVPINMATLALYLAGGLLGAKYATISLTVYVVLGACGIPVFSGFRGGLSVLAGPTGGYLIGYIAAVFIIGLILDMCYWRFSNSKILSYLTLVAAEIAGLCTCYAFGTVWFIISTGTGLWASLISCVFPFLLGDALKMVLATFLIKKLRPLLR